MKTYSIKYPQVPYSRDAGGCSVTGEPGGFYFGNGSKQTGTQTAINSAQSAVEGVYRVINGNKILSEGVR